MRQASGSWRFTVNQGLGQEKILVKDESWGDGGALHRNDSPKPMRTNGTAEKRRGGSETNKEQFTQCKPACISQVGWLFMKGGEGGSGRALGGLCTAAEGERADENCLARDP
jgi:hypothetical protein